MAGTRRAGIWGLFLASTLPVAILQSTTAQTDLVVASLVMTSYYLAAIIWMKERLEVPLLLLLALSAGLAIVTKEDALLSLIPLGATLAIMAWQRQWPLGEALRWGVVAVALCVVVTLPMTFRNMQLYGNPSGPSSGVNVSTFSPGDLATIAAESLLLNVDTLSNAENVHVFNVESSLARTLGWDRVNPDVGFTTTWPVVGSTPSEDGSGDLIAYLALIAAGALLLVPSVRNRIKTPGQAFLPFALSALASLVLILVMLKWQPWGARFQLMALYPLLTCVAITFAAVTRKIVVMALALVLVGITAQMMPRELISDAGKPLTDGPYNYLAQSRSAQYFRWCPGFEGPYHQVVDEVFRAHQRVLGYVSKPDDFEYPLWALLSQQAHGGPVRVLPLLVNGPSARLKSGSGPMPDVVLVSGDSKTRVSVKAGPLVRQGYRPTSVQSSSCGTLGIYTRGR